MTVRLVPVAGGHPVDLNRDVTLIGRGDGCNIRIDDRAVANRHCVLTAADGFVLVRDMQTKKGVRVNGKRVRRGVLFPGDQLGVAKHQFKVEAG
jgi:pSer/pThr/pTyr-binding forkhead associated (FHA) protein